MSTSRQLFTKLSKVIRSENRKGKSPDQIRKSPAVKKALRAYNTKTGYVISDRALRSYIKKSSSRKKSKKSSRKSRK
jgi:hypothetical protein